MLKHPDFDKNKNSEQTEDEEITEEQLLNVSVPKIKNKGINFQLIFKPESRVALFSRVG